MCMTLTRCNKHAKHSPKAEVLTNKLTPPYRRETSVQRIDSRPSKCLKPLTSAICMPRNRISILLQVLEIIDEVGAMQAPCQRYSGHLVNAHTPTLIP